MLRVRIGYPDRPAEREILLTRPARTKLKRLKAVMGIEDLISLQDAVDGVRMDESITEYVLSIAEATRDREELAIGLSPRGSLALAQAARASAMLDGRDYVVPDDVKRLATAVCAHRLVAQAVAGNGLTGAETAFARILKSVPAPQ